MWDVVTVGRRHTRHAGGHMYMCHNIGTCAHCRNGPSTTYTLQYSTVLLCFYGFY